MISWIASWVMGKSFLIIYNLFGVLKYSLHNVKGYKGGMLNYLILIEIN